MAVNPELEARLVAQPEIETYLVYGDWLSEHGDPRGELVAVQARLLADPGDRALRAQEAALLAANRHAWLGALADLPYPNLQVSWFCGFLEHVGIAANRYKDLATPAMLDALLACPAIAVLRQLRIEHGASATDRNNRVGIQQCLELLAARAPRALRSLELHSFEVGDFTSVAPALARLRTLELVCQGSPNLETLRVPGLRRLELDCGGMESADYTELLDERWRELERLVIVVGAPSHDEVGAYADVRALLHADFPNLRHLGLRGVPYGNELMRLLVDAPLLRRLETLDLSRSDIMVDGADLFDANAHVFAHLAELDLSGTLIQPAVMRDFDRRYPFVIAGDSRYRDDSYDDVYDY